MPNEENVVVVVAISEQSHSEYAFEWFKKKILRNNQHVILVTVVPSPMESEYFATLGSFSVPPMVYTSEHLEALKKKAVDDGLQLVKNHAAKLKQEMVNF
jgi:hypothetical protein